VKFVATKKGMTSNFLSPLSFVAVFGSGIGDKHPGSATLVFRLCLIKILTRRWDEPGPEGAVGG
jgi:hypothetical protein